MKCALNHTDRKRSAQAIMLVECLVYIAVFALLTSLAFAAYYRSLDNFKALRRNADDVAKVLRAGERWRQDLRSATGTPIVEIEEEEARLRLPHGKDEITYGYCRGLVWRRTSAQPRQTVVLEQVEKSQMIRDDRGAVMAWRWELELKTRQKNARLRPLFTFQAVVQPPDSL